MNTIKAITALAILAVAGNAQDSSRPDLTGLWHIYATSNPQKPMGDFTIRQSGDSVTVSWLPFAKPAIVAMDGKFETNSVITGKQLDTSAPEQNRWTPIRLVVKDSDHLEVGPGLIFRKASPKETAEFNRLRAMTLEKLPESPFNLNGDWQFEDGLQVSFAQLNGDFYVMAKDGSLVAKGRYESNPVIKGYRDGMNREDVTLTVIDPDHVSWGPKVLMRSSEPTHDVPCDDRNSSHVKGYYARIRGAAAYAEKDYKLARCWFKVGADQNHPSSQALLAALIMEGRAGTPPDYAMAFDLAKRSAENGSLAGQFQLAVLYREGKGTPRDEAQAKLWQDKAEGAVRFSQMLSKMTPERLHQSFGVVKGMFDTMVDTSLSMTPGSCFSKMPSLQNPHKNCVDQ